jgi:simple sugar transport system permease protein
VSQSISRQQAPLPAPPPARSQGASAAARRGHGGLGRALARPEVSALAGTIAVFVFFAIVAGSNGFLSMSGTINYSEVAAEVGIIAVPVSLLLIAGDFDLSVGSTVGAASIAFAYPIAYHGWPLWGGVLSAIVVAAVIGLINGILVSRTVVPSFIVTLAMMFIVEGAGLALTQRVSGGTQISGIDAEIQHAPLAGLFTGSWGGVPAQVIWWIVITLLGAWLLDMTRWGNWVYATGGNRAAARKMGIPVRRVRTLLYVATAVASALVAILVTVSVNVADVTAGTDKEFQAAAAAVIGGTLITGGYGSAIGTFAGALLYGMANQGFYYTNLNQNWFEAFIGLMLLVAVLINLYARRASGRPLRLLALRRGGIRRD